MTGSVRISQAMLALFLSPPDSPGIISPPITATSEQKNSINIHNSQFFQFGYCIDICINFFPLWKNVCNSLQIIFCIFVYCNKYCLYSPVLQIFLSLKWDSFCGIYLMKVYNFFTIMAKKELSSFQCFHASHVSNLIMHPFS